MFRRLLWLLPVALLFWNLGYAAFWNPDEGRYVAASYEMVHPFSGASDWLVPHLNTVPRLNKPPLIYWATALSFRVFGVATWSARLVPALASLLVLILIAIWGARCWGNRTAWAGAMVWASGIGVVALGRTANTDMLLCAAIALTMFGIFWTTELEGKKQLLMGALAGVGMGAALLTKGPVGVALPLLFAAIYLTILKNWKRAPWKALGVAVGVAALVGLPWFLLVEAQRPGFLQTFIFEENLGRFSGKEDYHKPTPITYYLPVVLLGFLPWTGLLAPALGFWNRLSLDGRSARQSRAQLFLMVWALALVAFFSISGTKLISYALPAFPAFALLIGVALGRWNLLDKRWKRVAIGVNILLNVALMVALIVVPTRDKATKIWHLKPGVLLDDHIIPRTVGEPWTWALVAILLVFSVALLWSLRRDGRTVLAIESIGAIAIIGMLLSLVSTISYYEDATAMVRNLAPILKPDDRVASYRAFVPGVILTIKRPLYFFQFDNSSGLNNAEVERSPFYSMKLDNDDFREWLAQPGRVFIITEGFENYEEVWRLHLWGRTNDQFLLSNQPRPANLKLELDFVAPDSLRKKHLVQPPK